MNQQHRRESAARDSRESANCYIVDGIIHHNYNISRNNYNMIIVRRINAKQIVGGQV